MNKLMFFLIALHLFLLCSCTSETYFYTTIVDSVYKERLLAELDGLNVSYKVDGDKIQYREEDAAKFAEAMSAVRNNYPALFTIKNEAIKEEFMERLDVTGVVYKMYPREGGGYDFIIENEYRNEADEILTGILNNK